MSILRNSIAVGPISLGITLFLGCSSSQIVGSSISSQSSGEKARPADIVEDAMTLDSFDLFSNQVSDRIRSIHKDPDEKKRASDLQSVICNGSQSKFAPVYKVRLVMPKTPSGLALDRASKAKSDFIAFVRDYLQARFFLEAATNIKPKLSGGGEDRAYWNSGFNSDYRNYRESKESGSTKSFGDRPLHVPVVSAADHASIEKFYSGIEFLPRVPNEAYRAGENLIAIIYPGSKSATLAPKVTQLLDLSWDRYSGKGEPPVLHVVGNEGANGSGGFRGANNLTTRSFYVPSHGWKVDGLESGGTLHPLRLTQMDDLSILVENFLFKLPIETARQFENLPETEFSELQGQYYGYVGSDLKFAPSDAINHADYVWEKVLKNQTAVREVAKPDGSFDYELSLSFDLFCKHGIAKSELKSN